MDDKWLEVTVDTTDAGIDDLSAYLTGFDTGGLAIEDEAEFHAFLEENRRYWDYVDDGLLERMRGVARVKFYVPDTPYGREKLAAVETGLSGLRARSGADLGSLAVHTASLKEEDWAYGWQKYYHPLAIGKRLYIVPEWEREGTVPEGRTAVCLNPGLTFGTGAHASTQLCLELLEGAAEPGSRVLDLGCGSGILSIAALRLGAAAALGVDIDPKAVDVAYENAALNGIGRESYTVRAGDVLTDRALAAELAVAGPYGVVLANIVADVIIPLSARVPGLLAEGGRFICSGIIAPRAEEVADALTRNGLRVAERREENGWVAFSAVLA